ncbi:Lecithin-cholesterol acyltransferase-like 4 [Hibiscus syriacus]|uniref:Lecithin-cholesterol acyltransferase-like 4 n=1 Tax=Hibiscus syriacus TaxID=106335 RepID=A0A6A2WE81_HIBSY|nr:Lecithin-cholesterol acyltransferase-like 4 [Hibiscus syriacus]
MAVLLEDIVKSVEMWLKLIKKPQPYVDPNLDPVLLVPGIAGSNLTAVDDQNGKEERVWVRILGADYKFRTKLWSRFDPSTGKTVSLDPNTTIKVPDGRYGLQAIDVLDPDMIIDRECVGYFHDMIVEMIKWGFQEGKTLFGFGYDFRQSNRLQERMDCLAAKLESVYNASGGKKINIISHSMGGLLVKCFMGLHSDIFQKYVNNWIAIAAPFRGAPGYIASTFLNGMSFVDGWEQNFFISKWSMHQLVDYDGENIPLPFNLEILKWVKETQNVLSHAKPKYVYVDGDGTVPTESAKADGLQAEARVAVPGEHQGILCELHVFRILKQRLRAGDPDPFYNPINDYVILPTAFKMESHREKGLQVTSLKEEWEIISKDEDDPDCVASTKPVVSSISVSQGGNKQSSRSEATIFVHPQNEGKQHVELNAVSVSVD